MIINGPLTLLRQLTEMGQGPDTSGTCGVDPDFVAAGVVQVNSLKHQVTKTAPWIIPISQKLTQAGWGYKRLRISTVILVGIRLVSLLIAIIQPRLGYSARSEQILTSFLFFVSIGVNSWFNLRK